MGKPIVRQVLYILAGRGRGAPAVVGAMLGISPSTVQGWTAAGRVPAKWQLRLIEAAREHGRPLEPKHFFELDAALIPPVSEPPAGGARGPEPCTAVA
ncbi:MAG TPA: hypothetical protein VES39_01130 [Rhodospirillales bacterium]|nr:hypothetical protein [Rhodospirillales bacterium]